MRKSLSFGENYSEYGDDDGGGGDVEYELDEDAEQRQLCSDLDQTLDQLRIYELIIELRDLLAKNIKHDSLDDKNRMHKFQRIKTGELKNQLRASKDKKRYSFREKQKDEKIETEPPAGMKSNTLNKSINYNLLEIPAELAFIYSQLDESIPVHSEKHLTQFNEPESDVRINKIKFKPDVPTDLNYFSFSKFLQIYIKDDWQREVVPIQKPFLLKSNYDDIQESLCVFKMILRCINTNEYDSKRDKALADFIVRKGLDNAKLRDEIFIQIVNQTWSTGNNRKAWQLMAYCLSCFSPSNILFKYLLNYSLIENEKDYNEFRMFCQVKLMQLRDVDNHVARSCVPTFLEWTSGRQCSKMAIDIYYIKNFDKVRCEVTSWTTCDELCRLALGSLNISETNGWTLGLSVKDTENEASSHEENNFELMSYDHVFDVVGELEDCLTSTTQSSRLFNLNRFKKSAFASLGDNNNKMSINEQLRQFEDQAEQIYGPSLDNNVGSITNLVRFKTNNMPNVNQLDDISMSSESSSVVSSEDSPYRNTANLLSNLNQNLLSSSRNLQCFRFESENASLKKFLIPKSDEFINDQDEENDPAIQRLSPKHKKLLKATLSKCSKLNSRYLKTRSASSRGKNSLKQKGKLFGSSNASSSGSIRSKHSRLNRRRRKHRRNFDEYKDKEKVEIEMGMTLNGESKIASYIDMSKIIQSIPKRKLDLDHFLDSLFDHALESENNTSEDMLTKSEESSSKKEKKCNKTGYENFINSIGDRYSFKFSSKFNQNDSNNFDLSARIKGGLDTSSPISEPEKKCIVKLIRNSPSSYKTTSSCYQSSYQLSKKDIDSINKPNEVVIVDNTIRILQQNSLSVVNESLIHPEPPTNSTVTCDNTRIECIDPRNCLKPQLKSSVQVVANTNSNSADLLQSRAKTVRIGKVRWPPPLNTNESFESELQRRLEVQRKIHEEIVKQIDKGSVEVEEEIVSKRSSKEISSNIVVVNGFTNGSSSVAKNQTKSAPLHVVSSSSETYASLNDKAALFHNYNTILAQHFDLKKRWSQCNNSEDGAKTNEELLSKFLQNQNMFLLYSNVNWSFSLRKEVFSPREKLETPMAIDLIFMQIIRDFNSHNCVRISETDRHKLVEFLNSKGLSISFLYDQYKSFKIKFKRQLIDMIKDVWPFYFCRLFAVEGSKECDMLAVSHSGVRLVNKEKSNISENLCQIEHFSLWEIREVNVPKENTLSLVVNKDENKSIVLHSSRANQIKKMIDSYLAELDQDTKYVQAIRDYCVKNKDTSLLGFVKNDIIKLVDTSYTPDGWLKGLLKDRQGLFPLEYVRPIHRLELGELYKNISATITDVTEITETKDDDPTETMSTPFTQTTKTEEAVTTVTPKITDDTLTSGIVAQTQMVMNDVTIKTEFSSETKPEDNINLTTNNSSSARSSSTESTSGGEESSSQLSMTNSSGVDSGVENGTAQPETDKPQRQADDTYEQMATMADTNPNKTLITTVSLEDHAPTVLPPSLPTPRLLNKENTTASKSSSEHYSMMEFAMMNFKQSIDKYSIISKFKAKTDIVQGSSDILNKLRDSRLLSSNSREWTWKDYAEMVKFSKSPIQTSLLKFKKAEHTNLAIRCFIEIMRFMGDYPLAKQQKDTDCIYFLLQTLHNNAELCDEVYCQLVKQTTNNKSMKSDSGTKGWRLISILCSYFKPTDLFKPYLFKYIESSAYDSKRPHNTIAQYSLTSLRKTFTYGGRRNVPSQIELDALITGRVSKRQMFILPGGTPILLNIRSYTVVQDCINELAEHLGVQDTSTSYEPLEFAIYYVVEAERIARPLNRREYIFDVITELNKNNTEYHLIFKRILWYFPLKFESESYVDMIYNQIMPDYLEGLLLEADVNKLTQNDNKLMNEIALLSALKHKISQKPGLLVKKDLKHILPAVLAHVKEVKGNQWLSLINDNLNHLENVSNPEAKIKFLQTIKTWPLFGSTFFHAKNVYDPRIKNECILAINKDGIQFLNKDKHGTILSFPFNEIISTRRFRAADTNAQFVDLKCGNLMVQKVTRIETDQGNEISILIGQYIELVNRVNNNQVRTKFEDENENDQLVPGR